MDIDRGTIEKVAAAARLKLTEEEIQKFTPQLKDAMDAFSLLREVDTDGVEPSFHPVEMHAALREDEPEACLSQEDALSLAKHRKEGYIMGPKAV